MDSSNSLSDLGGHYSRLPKNNDSKDEDELNRTKIHLQQVMKNNQELEQQLLIANRELEKEKDNSRAIVLTLTERLIESREAINKLEVENMRYKKDCLLAVELLQCNRSDDQGRISSAMKKLSDYSPTSHANKNADKHPTNEVKANQSTTKNTNEIPFTGKGIFQRPKPSRAAEGKAKREASRLIPEESRSVRDTPLVDSGALLEGSKGGSTKEGTPFGKDKPRFTEVKQAVPSRPSRVRGQENKYTSLMQDNIAITQEEDTSLVEKEMPFGEGIGKTTEMSRDEVTSTGQPLHQEDKPLTQHDDRKTSLQDELIKEECSLRKHSEHLTNVDTFLKPKARSNEAQDDTPLIAQDDSLTKAEPAVLTETNKPTADDDRTFKENEKIFDGGATEGAILKEGGETSTEGDAVSKHGACAKQGTSVAEENGALPDEDALLSEDGNHLVEEDGCKPLETQVSTKEKNEDSNNAPAEKETEDDTLAEEDTPLV